MNTAAQTRTVMPPWTTLRTVLAAASWANLLLALGWLLALALPLLGTGASKPFPLHLTLCACMVLFWAMLSGGRLIGTTLLASRLRLPKIAQQALRQALVALMLAVLIPTALMAAAGDTHVALNLLVLLTALLFGLAWVSMPPWIVWVLPPLGYALNWLLERTDNAWFQLGNSPLLSLTCAATFLVLTITGFCWWMRQRPASTQWSTSIAQLLSQDRLSRGVDTSAHAPFGEGTPVGHDLRRHSDQALSIALGPGFGRHTAKSWLRAQLPILGVAILWLLLNREDVAGSALLFIPLLAVVTAFPPVMRLQTLVRRPALGLHEPALLPGLPRHPANALASQLARQMLLRAAPAVLMLGTTAALLGAGKNYLLVLLWCCISALLWLHATSLFALQGRLGRAMQIALMVLLPIALVTTALPQPTASWKLPAWSVAMLGGALASALARRWLGRRAHPWLQT